jgi:hypothetical protein
VTVAATSLPNRWNRTSASASLKTAQMQTFETVRQARTVEPDLAGTMIEIEPEAGLYQGEEGGACPGLRRTRNRIHGRCHVASPKAAEQLGESPQFPVGGSIEQAGKDAVLVP